MAYAPPHSKGPGREEVHATRSTPCRRAPQITVPPAQVSRDVLLAAMKDSILASAELNVIYSRASWRRTTARRHARSKAVRRARKTGPRDRTAREGRRCGIGDSAAEAEAGRRTARSPPADDRKPDKPEDQPEPRGGTAASRQPVPVPGGHTVGLFKNDPQACPGYTLFAPKHHTLIYLMDNQGRAVHRWKSQYEPGQSVYLLENGHLLHCCFTKNKGFTSGGEGGRLEEFDWDGNFVWEFEYSTDQYLSHHDVKPLPNGNVLVLAVEKKSYEECLAAGFDPQHAPRPATLPGVHHRSPADPAQGRQDRLGMARLGPPDPGQRPHEGQLRRRGRASRS